MSKANVTEFELEAIDLSRRFAGIARLYGEQGLARLQAAEICVIGIGGVGSWVAESLARSGVGALCLIDMDMVAESNVNRQLVATSATLGRDKIEVMSERIDQINPYCELTLVDDFISQENVQELLSKRFDYVIDCIDDFRIKAAVISYCRLNKINLVTVGGAGGQKDPSKIVQSDLSKTEQDVLLARTRKLLRQDYRFPKNLKRSFGVPCIYSKEQLVYPDGQGGVSPQRPQNDGQTDQSNALNCAAGIGSITHITASFGLFASAHVLNEIAADDA